MLAVWYDGFGDDDFEPITLDCRIEFEARSAEEIDVLNGVRQQLDGRFENNTVVLPNLKIPDYPLIVVLEGA